MNTIIANNNRTAISRRRLLAGLGWGASTLGVALALPSPLRPRGGGETAPLAIASAGRPSVPFTCDLTGVPALAQADTGAPLVEPEVRRSVDGVLSTTLRVGYSYKDVGGYRLHVRTYEGSIPGPTLRLSPGDTLRIRLINDLPPNRDYMPENHNIPHHFNTTNFHFHGSHVSPSGISDNVLRVMEPGQSYDIEMDLPDDHTRGLYWYHPHNHGSADLQVASGMSGAIIVEGDFDDVPEIAQAQERVLVLNEVVFDPLRMVEEFNTIWSETSARFLTVNGQREPVIQMRPGEVQNWRILHAGYQDDFLITLEGHEFHGIANDGIQLDRIDRQQKVLMAPGQRIQALVKAGAPGTYLLHALPHDQGYPSPTGPLARVVVAGEPMNMSLPASLPSSPLATVRDAEITGRREVVFSAIIPEAEAAARFQEFAFLIDGKLFDIDRVDHRIRLGAVEEWTVINRHFDDHVFHIHINPVQVTQVNGRPLAQPLWADTVVVPRNGSITFRTRFEDFTGRYVLHCHMMNHEDLGMMQLIEVA